MREIPPMMCSKASEQYKDPYIESIKRLVERQKAIEKGIINIIIANKCSYLEAESILEGVKNSLKYDCVLCLKEGVKK